MVAIRIVVAGTFLLGGCGCATERPTVTGKVIDERTGKGVLGAIVSIRELHDHGIPIKSSNNSPRKPEYDVTESPEALVCTITHWDGSFTCEGQSFFIGRNENSFRVHVHRDDYNDSIYDFNHVGGVGLSLDRKDIGQIVIRSRSSPETSVHGPSATTTSSK